MAASRNIYLGTGDEREAPRTGPARAATFSQSTGEYRIDGVLLGVGWSGRGEGKNDPDAQHLHDVGPLPRGKYQICPPVEASTGPYSLRLIPLPGTDMLGREGFLIHGPAKDPAARGQESRGCPILARYQRELLWRSGVRVLEVIR